MIDWLFYEIPLWWALAGGVGYLVIANLIIYLWCWACRSTDAKRKRDLALYQPIAAEDVGAQTLTSRNIRTRPRRYDDSGNRPRYRRDDMTTAAILGGAIAGTEGGSSSSSSSDGGGGGGSSGGGGGE